MNTITTEETPPAAPTTSFPGAARAAHYVEQATDPEPVAPATVTEASATVAAPSVPVATLTAEPQPDIETGRDAGADDTDVDLGALSVATAPRVAQSGLRGLLGKMGVKLAPGSAETAAIDIADKLRRNEEIVRQATWTRAVSVLVANPKGGVGKTPTSLMLGGTLAAIRGGSVCIIEVSDDPGALTFRSEGAHNRGLGELVADADGIRSAGQLAGYTAPQSSFAAVIGSVGWRPRLDGSDVTTITRVVDDYFAIRVMDSGNQPSSSAFQAAVATADVLVIPIFDAGDAALEAANLLDGLRAAGGHAASLAEHAIVLRLHDGRPENPQVVARVDRILTSHRITHQHTIPFDSHIAERGQLTLAKLTATTRHAVTGAAADVVRTLQNIVR